MRAATAAVKRALANGAPSVLLAYFDLPDGPEYYWSGVGRLSFDGHEWAGVGGLASVAGLSSEASAFIQTITFSVAVEDAFRAALSDEIRGREAILWFALLDEHGQIIPDPIEIAAVQMDTMTLQVSEGTQQITIVGHTAFYTLEAPSRYLWTNEQQQFDYEGDTGWDRAPGNTTKEVTWSPP